MGFCAHMAPKNDRISGNKVLLNNDLRQFTVDFRPVPAPTPRYRARDGGYPKHCFGVTTDRTSYISLTRWLAGINAEPLQVGVFIKFPSTFLHLHAFLQDSPQRSRTVCHPIRTIPRLPDTGNRPSHKADPPMANSHLLSDSRRCSALC